MLRKLIDFTQSNLIIISKEASAKENIRTVRFLPSVEITIK